MDEPTKEQNFPHNHGADCCHGMYGHGFGHRYFLLRWLLGLAILVVVFAMGFKLGEFKGSFDGNGYGGYGKMHFNRGLNYGQPMMYNQTWGTAGVRMMAPLPDGQTFQLQTSPAQSQPATPSK